LLCARKESKIISQASIVFIFDSAFFYLSLTLLSFITFSTYAGTENTLTPKKVFTALTLFALLRLYCIQFVHVALLALSELYVAYKRIRISSQLYIQSFYYYCTYLCLSACCWEINIFILVEWYAFQRCHWATSQNLIYLEFSRI